jgi:methionyl-tRNA synthetase
MTKKTFCVTTPIYYVTAKPHLGSLYTTVIADVLARWNKLCGKQVNFLTGTDEHGQKIAQAAVQAGMDPQALVDSVAPAYQHVWDMYEISYDHFTRTTSSVHKQGVIALIKAMMKNGAIYKSVYEGWYCTPCETFVTQESKGVAPRCPTCGRETQQVAEQAYFFKLSAYQDKLLALYRNNPDFIMPRERANEVISFVEGGLKDLSISRTTVAWGIPFPDDSEHTVYVWIDALTCYISNLGYPTDEKLFHTWWPADVQVMGKDIVRFHAVYWPAFLMSVGLPLPKQLLVHGWIKVDQQKMSKSLGNVIDPIELQKKYGVEPVRYYLMRKIAVNQDGEFSTSDLEQVIASDLANDLGNLLQRMVTLAEKNQLLHVAPPTVWSDSALTLRGEAWDMIAEVENALEESMFHLALARIFKFIHQTNAYFHEHEPWKIVKHNPAQFAEIISATAHALRTVGILLWPVMPHKMEELLASLGTPLVLQSGMLDELKLNNWHHTFTLQKIPALFIRPEITKEEVVEEINKPTEQATGIAIDDFLKVELVVGTIAVCEPIEGSDKLLRLEVDFGMQGKRQILSGIKKSYSPSDLIGKQAVFVFNLKPRPMMGLTSHGMLLTAQAEDGTVKFITPAVSVPNGSKLK